MVQFMSNLLVAVVNCLYSCAHVNFLTLLLLAYLGASVIGTNILCHRYLLEKAKIMTKIINEPHDPSAEHLDTLQRYFSLEVRAFYPVVLGIVFHFVGGLANDGTGEVLQDSGYLILEYTILYIMANDLFFSVVITFLFLRPITQILHEGEGEVASQSKGYRHLRDTHRMTLLGSSLAVISSTYLYINLLLFFNASKQQGGIFDDICDFRTSTLWNPLVIAGNVDSMVNDFGMMFVCGVFKYASREKFRGRYSGTKKSNTLQIVPASGNKPLEIDSHAYD